MKTTFFFSSSHINHIMLINTNREETGLEEEALIFHCYATFHCDSGRQKGAGTGVAGGPNGTADTGGGGTHALTHGVCLPGSPAFPEMQPSKDGGQAVSVPTFGAAGVGVPRPLTYGPLINPLNSIASVSEGILLFCQLLD